MRHLLRLTAPLLCVALLSCAAVAVDAQRRGAPHPPSPPRPPAHGVVIRGEVFIGGYFYDPVWGPYPWWPRHAYPRYYPVYDYRAEVRLQVKPRETAVYVDGFFAGLVDEFKDGYRRFAIDLALGDAETAPLNVSLMPGGTP